MLNHLKIEEPLFEKLKNSKKNIAIYGMGNGAEKILKALDFYGLKAKCIFASDNFLKPKIFNGFPIISFDQVIEQFSPVIILVAFGTCISSVIKNINKISTDNELYFPDIEVCGDEWFDADKYNLMRESLNMVNDMLIDDFSHKVFNNLLLYKLSGKLKYLYDIESDMEEVYINLIRKDINEIYVDCGAYNGDTITEFITFNTKYKYIYAFEPDPYNFKKLSKKYGHYKNIKLLNAASHNLDGEVLFSCKKSRQSNLCNKGTYLIKAFKIDTIASDATFIKLDVEGNEYNSLIGCKNVIINNHPKLQIAAYHKNLDLLLPLEIKKMRKDYKVYLRHFHCIPAWDTYYVFT